MAITEKYASRVGAGANDGSSPANAWTFTQMVTAINALGAGGAAGLRVNYKNDGTADTRTATDTITASGTITSPCVIRGYTTNPGDGYLGRTNGNGPLITTNMPLLSYNNTFRLNANNIWLNFESLNISGSFSGAIMGIAQTGIAARCLVTNASTNAAAVAMGVSSRSLIFDCDAILSGASGGNAAILLDGIQSSARNSRVKGGPAAGIKLGSTQLNVVDGCIIYGCGGNGISVTSTGSTAQIINSTIIGNTGDGVNINTGSLVLHEIINNLITDNGGYGINGVSAANTIFAAYNRLDRNTSGPTNLATDSLAVTSYGHNTTSITQAQEYVNAAGNDYRLLPTSPAIGNGFFPYANIGALQTIANSILITNQRVVR